MKEFCQNLKNFFAGQGMTQGDVKKKPPYLSQARRPIQTLLTFSFPSTI